jgi:hypothetical protein
VSVPVDEYGEDGLLFSMEVLGLNLQGPGLISLSALDTAKWVIGYSVESSFFWCAIS